MAKRILHPKINTPLQFPASCSLKGRQISLLLHAMRKKLTVLQERCQRSSCHYLLKKIGHLEFRQKSPLSTACLNGFPSLAYQPAPANSFRLGDIVILMLIFINEKKKICSHLAVIKCLLDHWFRQQFFPQQNSSRHCRIEGTVS